MDTPAAVVEAHRVIGTATAALLATNDPAEMVEPVRQLATVLPGHFAEEERPGGWFERIRRHHRSAPVIDELVLEHQDLEATAELLASHDPAALPKGFAADCRGLARRLQEHERKETRLASSPD